MPYSPGHKSLKHLAPVKHQARASSLIFASKVWTDDSLCRKILPFLSFQIFQETGSKSNIVLDGSSVDALATPNSEMPFE